MLISVKLSLVQIDVVPSIFFFAFINTKCSLFLAFLAGFFQIGFGFILITVGSQTTPAAVVGVLMLTESVFGPLWAWLFINEVPPLSVLIGGGIIVFSILLQSFYSKKAK